MSVVASGRLGERLRPYAMLGKLPFYDYYLSALVVWALVAPGTRLRVSTLVLLALVTLGWLGICAATVAFDDVSGYRDGSDRFNYDPGQAQLRRRELKPLLDGRLTEGQAVRFAYGALAFGLCWITVAVLVSGHRTGWVLGLIAFLVVISVQYSYGLRLSYRGGQELVLMLSTGLVVLIPYGLLTGGLSGLAALESYLFGLWSLLVSLYSNIKDVDGDRAAGRRNLATMTTFATYRVIVVAITATEAGTIALAVALGAAPWWLLLALSPLFAMRVRQVRAGLLRGNPLLARKLGGQAHRLGVILLILSNLLIVH